MLPLDLDQMQALLLPDEEQASEDAARTPREDAAAAAAAAAASRPCVGFVYSLLTLQHNPAGVGLELVALLCEVRARATHSFKDGMRMAC